MTRLPINPSSTHRVAGKHTVSAARGLRKKMTSAEMYLWKRLSGRQLAGLRFRRQHPLQTFVLDFYCVSKRIAIELDGGVHAELEVCGRDAERSEILQDMGVRVLRFGNDDVLGNIDAVLEKILQASNDSPS